MTRNFAVSQDVGLQEGHRDAFQLNVAVGSIDKGVIVGCEVEGVLTSSDDEIGYVDPAARFDVAQNSAKIIVRGKRSANAVKDAEVRLLEVVLALDGRLPRISVVPWADFSVGTNFAWGKRVVQHDIVRHRVALADRGEFKGVDFEEQGRIIVGARNFDGGAIGDDFFDEGCGFRFLPVGGCDGSARRWDIDAKTVRDDTSEMARAQKHIDIVGLDGKTLNGDDGWRVGVTAEPPER